MIQPGLLDSLPASVEMAAGAGKTWTLADTVRTIAGDGGRALVLTHTIAGVHALRTRLRAFDVDPAAYHVATLTSFSIELAYAYCSHAGIDPAAEIDLTRSNQYTEGAVAALQRRHIQDVYRSSFSHVLVDEYQDCSKGQHELVLALKRVIPETAVFGDRLQGIFGFADPLVDWEDDVLPEFPSFEITQRPRRWLGHNEALGDWLLNLRSKLVAGATLDLTRDLPAGVAFRSKTKDGRELVAATRERRAPGETVVVITGPAVHAPRSVAKRFVGYAAMEELGGSFMAGRLKELSLLAPEAYAAWLAALAKDCYTGYAKLDGPILKRLAAGHDGKAATDLARPGLEQTISALDQVRLTPTLTSVAQSMTAIQGSGEARLHSREAWRDIALVVESCSIDPDRDMVAELGRVRERVRHGGRGAQHRSVSRTVLIKGLEYDHVIIADLADVSDASNLYVALSRARKTITIIGPSPHVVIKETKRK